jgi:hypothetical protein
VFHATLDHWRELNLTAEFQDCVHKLFQFVSLPQVRIGVLCFMPRWTIGAS